jgi:predicted RNA-binding protein associated with RNAse of E/G family
MELYDDPAVRPKVCATLASGRWRMVKSTWHTNRALWIWPRGCSYMIGLFWEDASDRFRGWYFNLQTPLRRSSVGFDLFDYLLDVVVRPDRTWFWKDEDEFANALRLGVIEREDAAAVRAQGELLTQQIDELLPTGWEDWRPGTGWPPLVLPSGWQNLE